MVRPSGASTRDNPIKSFFDDWAPKLSWIGGGATFLCLAYLVWSAMTFSGSSSGNLPAADAVRLTNAITLAGKVLIAGIVLLCLGVGWQYMDEGTVGPIYLVGAAVLYWGIPLFINMNSSSGSIGQAGLLSLTLTQFRLGALAFVLPGILLLIYAIASSTHQRSTVGVKKDQLEYGKEVKEEPEVRNVFLGKCWQLPYCRKFIRVKCPIFLSKRCCWRERVGCMCEESVIRNAMEGTVQIPKDVVAAARYIPYNNKLPMADKRERCRNCVIYNEHQRQKYKLVAPIAIMLTIAPVVFMHDACRERVGDLLTYLDKFAVRFSLSTAVLHQPDAPASAIEKFKQADAAVEILLVALAVIILAYLLRLVEYALFKLKI
jgi:hypothetical protein